MINLSKIMIVLYITFSVYLQAYTTLATVGKHKISTKDISQYLKIAAPRVKYSNLKKQEKELVLKQVIDRHILLIIAKKSNIDKKKKFKEGLDFLKQNYTIDFLMREKAGKIKVSSKKAKNYFNTNKSKFQQPASYLVSHILLESKKQANMLLAKLNKISKKNLEKKFKDFATQYSIGPSKKNGGSLEWVQEKDMLPEFYKEVKSIKKGNISKKVVKTSFGYHIIEVIDKIDSKMIKFEKIKDKLIEALVLEELKIQISKEVEQVKKFINISIE